MRDFGGMVSFLVESEEEAVDLVARTKVWTLAESLGGVESLIEHPDRMTHASTASGPFASPRNLVRLSAGIESADDLVADLEQALAPVRAARRGGDRLQLLRVSARMNDRPGPRSTSSTAARSGTSAATSSRPTTACALRLRADDLHAGAEGGPRASAGSSSATSGICCSRTSTSTTPAPPARSCASTPRCRCTSPPSAHRISSTRAGSRRARAGSTATRSTASGASSFPCRRRTSGSSATTSSGSSASRARATPATTSRCCTRTARSTPATRPGVRIAPGALRAPPTPPPDIDLEAWEQTIAATERREPARLALTHFGVFEDVAEHLARLRETLHRWGERVAHGMDEADVRRRRAGGLPRVRSRTRSTRTTARRRMPSASSGSSATGASD